MFDGTTLSGPATVPSWRTGGSPGVDTTGALPPDEVELIDLGADVFLMPGSSTLTCISASTPVPTR